MQCFRSFQLQRTHGCGGLIYGTHLLTADHYNRYPNEVFLYSFQGPTRIWNFWQVSGGSLYVLVLSDEAASLTISRLLQMYKYTRAVIHVSIQSLEMYRMEEAGCGNVTGGKMPVLTDNIHEHPSSL